MIIANYDERHTRVFAFFLPGVVKIVLLLRKARLSLLERAHESSPSASKTISKLNDVFVSSSSTLQSNLCKDLVGTSASHVVFLFLLFSYMT